MTKPEYPHVLLVKVHEPLTGTWEKDRVILEKAAQQPTLANEYYNLAAAIMGLFQQFTYGTPSQPNYPQRIGLLRKVYDELYPIGHFANLYFTRPENVVVQWVEGNQQHDAIVEYKAEGSNQSDISYLEITTLQDQEDADELKELSKSPSVTTVTTNSAQKKHGRKIERLKKVLEKKAGINYPAQTALLVYTDEDRFRQYSFGLAAPEIDKKADYEAVLREFEPSLQKFSHVFIFSKHEIYCAWSPAPKVAE
ncbi:Unknown protein sequence [Pseudomonas amygdali pv. mori]|uniref:Uncharacterized protein n=2 Tax=Pseudomonas syringae group TaxID=136849 RepID=A0A0P9V294_PSEA0|nr:hypothetical protein [Pseudomonas sp. 25 E 4]KPX96816.1 Unknown protein sequence [Pseudomonas amygdali pv. mori]CRM61421.1 hypothetical protein [Pseudomonas sp. 25 E 4]